MTARRTTVPAAALLLALGCAPAPPLPIDAVATVGEQVLRYADFEAFLRTQAGEGSVGLPSEVLGALFDQFLDQTLIARITAAEEPESAPPEAVPESAVERYYAAHAAAFARPERVRLRQILVADRDAAEAARARITAGADFAEVARAVSADPSAAEGGDQGELAREDLPPALAAVVFDLAEGEVSEVVPGADGYRLFLAEARQPAVQLPLDAVRGEVRRELERRAADRRLAALLDEARRRFPVRVMPANLPFDYRGRYAHDDDPTNR